MVDEAIGLVLNGLDNLDLTDSTIVFAADHSDMEVAHNRFGKDAYFLRGGLAYPTHHSRT